MAAMTIRNLPDEIHRALKLRAAEHGRSAEAEVRLILEQAVSLKTPELLGSRLRALREELGSVDLDIDRAQTPMTPASFE